ncbi:MAG: succinate dehydrogenase, cytochrome b556 subunit [Gammaproteobacteria bacterium]|nr:succinate dehydrogenase, cytochrome b556 subunit [Gammaproteobacteria bacterium]MBT3858874.1 succinate dehydrogenase, cytochrome b556 subunit [Gammaproteobacteria bacterium]MBT3986225.1 succinate dehydrogenase, cytochrome b556 subunit [Gammaproteobacteria bacterium]MBT4256237.1 succinate dehydrogenase, cytochrome b556 subunit [Gammaproteobacteria bacterium]MBT4582414.1 succinate dehydrogenase, cytochrome b556 subunit [Gammaproteobacteria bacterium]
MKDNRPKNLDLFTIKYPLPAITSLMHRLSGAFIFFGVAVLLYLLELSLQSESGFALVLQLMDNLLVKLLVWAVVAGLLYHLIAGIKHLLMDLGIGETMKGGVIGASLTLLLSACAIVISGVWIW